MSQDIPQVAEISRLRFTYNFRRKLLTTPISDIMIFANSTYDAMMNESFVEVAERMAQHKVSALPVWDINEGKYLGFLHQMDLLSYFISSLSLGNLSAWQNASNWRSTTEANVPLSLFVPNIFKPHPNWKTVDRHTSVQKAINLLAEGDTCRLAVVHADGSLDGIITQSSIMRFLAKRCSRKWMGPIADLPLKKLNPTISQYQNVAFHHESTPCVEAFSRMMRLNVDCVAVVDDKMHVKGVLSASDLKYFGWTSDNFGQLLRPATEFLRFRREQTGIPSVLSVTLDDTFGHMMSILKKYPIHQLVVLDDRSKPLGFLNLTNVFQLFVRPVPSVEPSRFRGVARRRSKPLSPDEEAELEDREYELGLLDDMGGLVRFQERHEGRLPNLDVRVECVPELPIEEIERYEGEEEGEEEEGELEEYTEQEEELAAGQESKREKKEQAPQVKEEQAPQVKKEQAPAGKEKKATEAEVEEIGGEQELYKFEKQGRKSSVSKQAKDTGESTTRTKEFEVIERPQGGTRSTSVI